MSEPAELSQSDVAKVVHGLAIATFRWFADDDAMRWSANAEEILGLTPPATGRALLRLLTGETAVSRGSSMPALTLTGSEPQSYELRFQLKNDGSPVPGFWFEERGMVLFAADGRLIGSEGTIRRLPTAPLAAHDQPVHPTTGLMLRDDLIARLGRTIRDLTQARDGSAAFVVIALDGLGSINSNFGYDVGDRIIKTAAQRIARQMRQGDLIGHVSGHKFGAVLHHCSETALSVAAERFRDAVSAELIATGDTRVQASISIGAVIVPRHADTADQAALRAEEALNDARAAGTGLAVFHPSRERDLERRRNIDSAEEIAQGLAEDRFVIAYQPLMDANSRKIVSYEALARLVRRDGTVISAGPLVETAERIGLVRRIDQRALALVLDDLIANPGLRLSVNVSVVTLADGVWLSQLIDTVHLHRGIANRLTIEITETATMSDPAEMLRIVQTIRDVGAKVAIDDFGSGHTSFKALRDMEVDLVKIDGLYVRDLSTNPDSVAFVKSLAALVDHFKIGTVAEWVQDETSAKMLADLGIDTLQGRFAGEPMLRETALTKSAIALVREDGAERQADGYPSFAGVLRGGLSVG